MGGNWLNRIRRTRVKWDANECSRINSGVRQGCIMFSWLFNVYMVSDERGAMWMGRRGESRDCLTSCMQMTWFCVASRRKR